MQVIIRLTAKQQRPGITGLRHKFPFADVSTQNAHAQGCEQLNRKTSPPGPFNEVWQVVEKTECVEGIASDLCHSPRDQKKHHALLILDLQNHREIHSVVSPWTFSSVKRFHFSYLLWVFYHIGTLGVDRGKTANFMQSPLRNPVMTHNATASGAGEESNLYCFLFLSPHSSRWPNHPRTTSPPQNQHGNDLTLQRSGGHLMTHPPAALAPASAHPFPVSTTVIRGSFPIQTSVTASQILVPLYSLRGWKFSLKSKTKTHLEVARMWLTDFSGSPLLNRRKG